jgi:hypothetical protein
MVALKARAEDQRDRGEGHGQRDQHPQQDGRAAPQFGGEHQHRGERDQQPLLDRRAGHNRVLAEDELVVEAVADRGLDHRDDVREPSRHRQLRAERSQRALRRLELLPRRCPAAGGMDHEPVADRVEDRAEEQPPAHGSTHAGSETGIPAPARSRRERISANAIAGR